MVLSWNQTRVGESGGSKEETAKGTQQEAGMLMFTEALPRETGGWVFLLQKPSLVLYDGPLQRGRNEHLLSDMVNSNCGQPPLPKGSEFWSRGHDSRLPSSYQHLRSNPLSKYYGIHPFIFKRKFMSCSLLILEGITVRT